EPDRPEQVLGARPPAALLVAAAEERPQIDGGRDPQRADPGRCAELVTAQREGLDPELPDLEPTPAGGLDGVEVDGGPRRATARRSRPWRRAWARSARGRGPRARRPRAGAGRRPGRRRGGRRSPPRDSARRSARAPRSSRARG